MGERVVTLKLKLNDDEIKSGTISLNRLNEAAHDVGKQGSKDLEEFEKATEKATHGLESFGFAGGPATAAMAVLGAAIAAVAAGVVFLTVKLVEVTRGFADYGKEIANAQARTGLTAQTISALKGEVEALGGSFDMVQDGLSDFQKKIGDAANGAKKPLADLRSIGIDATKVGSDLDGAFRQAVKTINDLPPGIQRTNAAMAAFGENGAKLLPFLTSFNGDVDELIKKHKELGTVLSQDDVQASKEFQKALGELHERVKGLGYTFGRELLPILDLIIDRSDTLFKDGSKNAESWAANLSNSIRGIISIFDQLSMRIGGVFEKFKAWVEFQANFDPVLSHTLQAVNAAQQRGRLTRGLDQAWKAPEDEYQMWKEGRLPMGGSAALPSLPGAAKKGKGPFQLSSQGQALVDAANRLGVSPLDLATIIGFETGGSYSPGQRGGAGNLYRGLIQFGPKEQRQFGVTKGQSFEDQIKTSVVEFFEKRFGSVGRSTQGASILDLYATVLGGNPNANIDAKDAFGTSARSGVAKMLRDHRPEALKRFFGGSMSNVGGSDFDKIDRELGERSTQLTQAARDANTRTIIEIYKRAGFIPTGDQLKRIQALMVGEAKKAGTIQPTDADVRAMFGTRGVLSTADAALPGVQRRPSLDEDYVKNFRESLGLEERMTELVFQQRNHQGVINELVGDYVLSLDEAKIAAETEYQILLKRNLVSEAETDRQRERNALVREIGDLQKAITNQGANDSLIIQAQQLRDILDIRNRELDAVIRINRAQLELSQAMKVSNNQIRADVFEHLAAQKTLNEAVADGINGSFDAIAGRMDESIDKMFEWAGAFKDLFAEPLKAITRNAATNITKGLLDAFFPGAGSELTKTTNPIARPIVDELETTNKLLGQLVRSAGQSPASGGLGSLGGLFGLGGGVGGIGVGGTPVFNPAAGGGSGGFDLSRLLGGPSTGGETRPRIAQVPGKIFGDGGLFGRGGIFGNKGFGFNTGTASGLLSIASMAGGAIGGRVGGLITNVAGGALTGLMLGAKLGAIGGPWGAAIGAAAGFAMSILGGLFSDPKRKRDKNEKIPQLNKGFTDALKELNDILAGVRTLSIDPDEAIRRASEVRGQISGGFGLQFESKKYRKQSQTMITGKLREADTIIDQIKAAAEIARGAADRSKRILPEFAGGHYFADYFRPNGLMPGIFDGRDNILAMISRGEMVLNPSQQARVKALAGGDVFAGAGIPNYPKQSTSPQLAVGGIAGAGLSMEAPVMNQSFTLILKNVVPLDDTVEAYIESDRGRRKFETVMIEEKKKNPKL